MSVERMDINTYLNRKPLHLIGKTGFLSLSMGKEFKRRVMIEVSFKRSSGVYIT